MSLIGQIAAMPDKRWKPQVGDRDFISPLQEIEPMGPSISDRIRAEAEQFADQVAGNVDPLTAPRISETPPLETIEISPHHGTGGVVAVLNGFRGIGATQAEALGQLVTAGAFGPFYILAR